MPEVASPATNSTFDALEAMAPHDVAPLVSDLGDAARAIMDSMVGNMCVLDRTGVIVAVNRAWAEFGRGNGLRSSNYGLGFNYLEACRGDRSALGRKVATGLSEVLFAERSLFVCRYPCHSPTEQRWFELRASRASVGTETYVVVVHNPITPLRKTELRLRKRNRTLKAMAVAANAATKAKSDFLASMSHEIRTPLTGVLGFAGLLEGLPDLPEVAQTYVKRIVTSGATLLSVVDDILDFSKLDAGETKLNPQPFDPTALVDGTAELVAHEARRKGLTLTVDVEGDLPPAVLADSGRVRQVLLNLLSNAIKFTEAGEICVTVGHQRARGGKLRIAVVDSGIGIPDDQVHLLFQRFSQVDGTSTRGYGGTGLGLAICKSLVELMGGRIGVEGRQGEGSTFWFEISAPRVELPPSQPGARAEEPASAVAVARILLVDDGAMNRELVRAMLAPFPYAISEAADGPTAVSASMSAQFDLILMDLQMPGMDGLATTRAIRASDGLNRQTPIVALSANALPLHVAECREAGMDDHIAKPISVQELLTKISQWTQGERRERLRESAI